MDKTTPDYPLNDWRLIVSPPQPGALNMAIDSAILSAVEDGQAPTTLRLYSWKPPCLSLGYSQPFGDINLDQMEKYSWDIVRRPTGGRAILHTDELTYAVIGRKSDPRLTGGLMESYRRLSEALYRSLQLLGLPVKIHQGKNPLANSQPVCFENPSDFEITVNGKKIIGSAQARKKNALLQHGSLPLGGDLTRITKALMYNSPAERQEAANSLLQKATTAETVLETELSWDIAAEGFMEGFSSTLNLRLKEDSLNPYEETLVNEFLITKFDNDQWTKQHN